MDKQRKKRIKQYISWVLILSLVAVLAVLPMVSSSEETDNGPQASVLSEEAQLRNITTQLIGGGALTAEDPISVTIPSAVKLKEYLVENGDPVTAGQEIAAVDRVTVMTAITQVQETMEYLQEQIDDCSEDEAADEVVTQTAGIVKCVYAQAGDNVQDVMLENGALAVLSLDGLMAVKVQRATDLSGGDTVCVTLSDGTEADGRVESNMEGVLIVTVEDEGFSVGEKVTVKTEDGDRLGSGSLYIHSQWNAVGYSGTVSKVRVSEGDEVSSGKTLFDLEDTGVTARFETLTRQHRQYEELLLELFCMYQSQRILAPNDGVVTGVDESGTYMLSDSGSVGAIHFLANAPNGDDETTYIHYIGQVAEVGLDGLILNLNPQPLSVADYMDLSGLPLDTALMTQQAVYKAQVPVYELAGGTWTQIDAGAITAGDILLFAGDSSGEFVWVVRVAAAAAPESPAPTDPSTPSEPADPTEPSTPADSTEPTEPAGSTDPTEPSEPAEDAGTSANPVNPSTPSGGMAQGGMSFPTAGGSMTEEETYELYGLETVTIASVTPQETLTLQIQVDEWDIAEVSLGQAAMVTVDALNGEKFDAVVTEISASGENEGGNSKFTVELTMERAADMLAGMSACAFIDLQTAESAVTVPVAALIEKDSQTLVYTGYDEKTQTYCDPVDVTVGVSDGEYAQILSGISAGQTVYYPYYDTLTISNVPDAGLSMGFRFGR